MMVDDGGGEPRHLQVREVRLAVGAAHAEPPQVSPMHLPQVACLNQTQQAMSSNDHFVKQLQTAAEMRARFDELPVAFGDENEKMLRLQIHGDILHINAVTHKVQWYKNDGTGYFVKCS